MPCPENTLDKMFICGCSQGEDGVRNDSKLIVKVDGTVLLYILWLVRDDVETRRTTTQVVELTRLTVTVVKLEK